MAVLPAAASASGPTVRMPWLGSISITAKLTLVVIGFAAVVVALTGLLAAGVTVNHGLRAYLVAEGLWSKGQKDAVYYLTRYARSEDERDYQKYLAAIAIPLADRDARRQLEQPQYDYAVVERGFVLGGNAREDVPAMIFMFRKLGGVGHFKTAIGIWREGDAVIEQLVGKAEALRAAVTARAPERDALLEEIEHINTELTRLERAFSATLIEGAHRTGETVLRALLLSTVVLLALGVALAWMIGRELRSSILILRRGAQRVAHGDLEHPIELRTRDELAELATAFNEMVAQRRDTEAALKASTELAQSVVATAYDAFVAMDADGRVSDWNRQAEQVLGWSREEALGRSLAELIIPPQYRAAHEQGRQRFLKTGEGPVLNKRIEITALNRQGREFPVELTIWATRIGATYRFNAFLHDISDKHRAAKRLMAQNAAATALVESPTLAAGGVAVLKAVCEALGWDVGAIWLPDPDGAVLRCAQLWHRDGVIVPAFEAVSRASSFPPGVGLPGRVWQTGQPAWIPDVSRDRNFPRAQYAEQDGLHGAFGFPIRKGGELLGVIEFFSHAIQAPDDELLKMLETLGNLLGQFVGRQRAEAAIKRLSRMHAVLSSINSLIVRVRNREDLLRAVTRVAAEQGGFLSVSIALRGADGGDAPAWLHEGPLGSALQNERSCVVNDVDAAGAPWRAAALAHGARAVLACPLMGGGKALGGIAYCAAEPGFFDTEEIKLLSEVADNIAYAMEFIAKEEKLDHLAYYDSLTQLANRNLFLERLGQFLQAARQQDGGLATVLLDLEHFKALNDTVGIAGGDVLLREVAARLLATVETPSCVARIGGDVFAVVLPRVKDSAELPGILRQRIWRAFDGAFSLQGQELRLDAKLGIALYPEDGADAESLFHNAEAALAKAKESGERYMLYTQQMTTALKERLSLEGGLRRALEQGEYLLHYQPRVDLRTGAICGAEALLRWNAPGLGLVPPTRFVPVLEETGLILEVGRWVLAQASADRLRWQEQIAAVPRIAVNVSPVQLRRPDFVATLRAALPDGAAPGIDLEVTESVLMQNIEQHIGKLREVRDLGLEIAIDDFGTGYSSLAYLAKLPVNSVKIDRSFVASMTESPTTMNVVSTIISLAHSMNLRVVAEGVESQEQLRFLRLLRCDEMQGYLFSRPLPADEFAALLRTARLLPLA